MLDIDTKGYCVLRNVLSDYQLSGGLNTNTKINYHEMKQFIDTTFFDTIKKHVDFLPDPHYAKFRYSNNNNSTDAATFHSDIYNYTDSKLLPIYTCLCYFDDTQMELIPGTHLYDRDGYSVSTYGKKEILDIRRGDILIFHANIHHRGTGFTTNKNRRLLQVFEVFPDKETYDKHSDKLVIVESSKTTLMPIVNNISYYLSKNDTVQNTMTVLHYCLMYNDLHYKMGMIDISPSEKKDKYVSYEPGRRISYKDITDSEDINVNIICDPSVKTANCGNYYLYFYILYWIVSLVLFYLIYNYQSIIKTKSSAIANKIRMRTFV